MDSLPTWALWSIVVPLILLSPVIAFLLALTAEILVVAVLDEGMPAIAAAGAGVGGLLLLRRLRAGSRRAASSET